MRRKVIALLVLVFLMLTTTLVLAHHPVVAPVVPVVTASPQVAGASSIAAWFLVPMAVMFYYDVTHKWPPAFAGQQWDSCANAKKFSGTEKACKSAGFLH